MEPKSWFSGGFTKREAVSIFKMKIFGKRVAKFEGTKLTKFNLNLLEE